MKQNHLYVFFVIIKGINVTAADTCIIYDSDWNPQQDLQVGTKTWEAENLMIEHKHTSDKMCFPTNLILK